VDWLYFREPVNSWTHLAWMLLSLPGTVWLWRLARGDRVKQVSLAIFGLSMTACYAGSTLYHSVRLSREQIDWCQTLDFIGVYLLIAGTATPLALVILRGPWRWSLLMFAWLLAAGGIGLRLAAVPMSRALSTGIYLGMGWTVLLCAVELLRILPWRALLPAVVGGLLYSAGAIMNHVHWPRLWPGVFSAHELFHLFVMGGSFSHFWFVVRWVVPFQRPGAARVAGAKVAGDIQVKRADLAA
jgi:hemolysin III